MYYPYFRGKQYELIAIRETAELMAEFNITPIIEPVRESLSGLKKALDAVRDAGGTAIVVENPFYGDLQQDGDSITELLNSGDYPRDDICTGILLHKETSIEDAASLIKTYQGRNPFFIHSGFMSPKEFASQLGGDLKYSKHVFIEKQDDLLYRKTFSLGKRILIRDGFDRQKNADYPTLEKFSELHVTYGEIGMQGFGDFLIVGDAYSDGGGPAYAVAIHLTVIDSDNDNRMLVFHFVSDTKDTPTDPAGKFKQALSKLIDEANKDESKILETSAVREFRTLHERGHFPGLGYIKKLSLKHHIETMADFIGR